jgi:16S rRNA (guanine527-N7)-methyltransferase
LLWRRNEGVSHDPLARLADAASAWGVPLETAQLDAIGGYLREVAAKNQVTNLTAEDGWDDLVLKHAADGVFAASILKMQVSAESPRVCDLGAGGGFIGVCLKLAWPQAEVTLMESVERKFKFLNAEAARLGVKGLRVLQRRAGDGRPYNSYESGFDAVVERALAPLDEALGLAKPLLKKGGLLAAFQSAAVTPALAGNGLRLLHCHAYRRPGEAQERFLAVFRAED